MSEVVSLERDAEYRADAMEDAFEEFIGEIRWTVARITHPYGRRADHIDSLDQIRVDALNELIDAGNALLAKARGGSSNEGE